MDGNGVMEGENVTKLGEKKRFGNLAVGDKKGENAEGGGRKGGGGTVSPWTPIPT